MYMGSKKYPYEGGGGGIKFKRKSHKSSHNNFRKKVKKNQGRMAHDFYKDEGGRLTPPPQLGFTLSQDVIFIHMLILIKKNQGSMTVVSIKY